MKDETGGVAAHCASASRLFGSLLIGDGRLLAHGGEDGDEQVLAIVERRLDLRTKVAIRDTYIVLGRTILIHQVEEAVIDVHELVLRPGDVRDIHVVRGRADILHLLAGEDLSNNWSTQTSTRDDGT
jgi:hypothetical protein